MGFIAGYAAPAPLDPTVLRERLTTFPLLHDDLTVGHETSITATRFGHLLTKFRPAHPLPPTLTLDAEGNALLILGFLGNGDTLADPRALLEACVRTSGAALEGCAGEFVAVFAEAGGTLHLVNDRFGSRPCYVVADRGAVYFSSSLAFLLRLAGPRQPDPLGWIQICALRHTLGTRTVFADLQRLMPGSHATVAPASVSGGLDSRLVAAAVGSAAYPAVTVIDEAGTDSTPQTRAAADVAQALHIDHHVVRVPSDRYARLGGTVVALTGGLRALHNAATVMTYVETLRQHGKRFLLGGGPGDTMAGSAVPDLSYLAPADTEACMAKFCRARAARFEGLRRAFRDDALAAQRRPFRDSIERSIDGLTGTAAHRVTAWRMIHRQPAFTFTSVMHTHPDVGEAFCHLDYRYIDLMLRLPAAWLYKRNFYAYMIHREIPALRHIPYANTGQLLTGRLHDFRPPHALQVMVGRVAAVVAKGMGRAGRLLAPRLPARRLHLSLLRDESLLGELEDCLEDYGTLGTLLDAERCRALIKEFRSGGAQHESLLGGLATMCLAPRYLGS